MPDVSNVLRFPTPASPPVADEALPPDHEAREHALDVNASWIVEAPAGSGKTGLLMQRYLKLLATVDEPEEVLAITFTRKATAELRERILHQLQTAAINPIATNPGDPSLATALSSPKVGPPPPSAEPLSPFAQTTRTLAESVLLRDTQRGWGLLDRPQRLAIRTIDSVCAEIAAALPLLSGSAAARTPSDQPQQLYRQAAQRTLMQLGGPNARLDAALHTVLRHRDASLSDVETLLARMLGQREQWGELVPLGDQLDDATLDTEVRPRLERALEAVVCTGLTRAAKAMSPDVLSALSWLAASLAGEPGYKEPSPIALCANRQESPEERAEHIDHWLALINLLIKKDGGWRARLSRADLKFEITPAGKAQLEEILADMRENESLRLALCDVRNLPPARYPDNQWDVAKALFHLLVRAQAELKVLFAEREQCDFTELTVAAKHALLSQDGPADLALASGVTLRHLLVDEMQDTSSSQYELIELLSHSWDGHSQTLFLVGDPKQSIYLFRQARVERFLRAMREARLGDIPLSPLYLTANFRSQAALVDDFNSDFGDIFPPAHARDTAPDVPFVQASPIRKPSPQAAARVWHTCVTTESTHSTAEDAEPVEDPNHREEEARAIRQIVETWRARPLPEGRTRPWSIAVLARTREHLADIIRNFHTPGDDGHPIPFTAVDIERLGEQVEVLDLLALTRALLHPADRVAWLAVLHAPWCGLGIADLLALAGNGAPEAQYESIPATAPARRDLLSPEGTALIDRAWPVLHAALQQRGRGTTATWIERTWRSLGGDATLSPQQLANAALFFTALRKAEEPGGRLDLPLFTTQVKELFAEPQTTPGAVTLSTIHKAKGLEWDVVLVPGLERPARASSSELLNWLELEASGNEQAHVILAPIWGKGGEQDALYKWLNSVRCEREAAERKRLFYVASTRAREELHLFAAATRRQSGELSAPAGTLLQAAWPAAEPHFQQHATPPAQASQPQATAPDNSFTLALAASGSETSVPPQLPSGPFIAPASGAMSGEPQPPAAPPLLHRLPLSFSPTARFAIANADRLPYTPASALRQAPSFTRPEGSHAVRAFGNVVHRYLQLLADRLATAPNPAALSAELPNWTPRLTASFRAEGLSPAALERLAARSLHALQQALADPIGLWLLSPHASAASEQSLRQATPGTGESRVDRIFLAGPTPLSTASTHLWIVDFKTTEQGSRTDDAFAAAEREKYAAQLQSYARAHAALPGTPPGILLGLYYPLVPRLIWWPAAAVPS